MFTMTEIQGLRKAVMVPTDAQGWELYEMAGVEKAAKAIHDVVVEAVSSSSVYRAAVKVNAVLKQFENYGATDTEPRHHANRILSEAFGVHDALYLSRPVPAAIPGLRQLKEKLAQKKEELDQLTKLEDHRLLDAQTRDHAKELHGFVAGLQFAIRTVEGA